MSNPISRLTRGLIAVGGTSTTNANTAVVADSSTNEFRIVAITNTVTGSDTSVATTFTDAFVAAPAFAIAAGSGDGQSTIAAVTVTVDTTTCTVAGLSTAGPNNVPVILYGYTRTGTFP